MSYYPVKLRRSDSLFSLYIRKRAGYKCENCKKLCKVGDEWVGKLEASHYFGRGHESTRFNPDNVISLCFNCHKRMGGAGSQEYDEFMLKRLGEQGLGRLTLKAKATFRKRDDKMDTIIARKLLESLDDSV